MKAKPTVYLAHPIVSANLGSRHWKDEFFEMKSMKPRPYTIIDPSRNGHVDGRDNKKIVRSNKAQIINSSVVVAYTSTASAGTSMEILFAHMMGVPVLSYNDTQVPAWVAEHSRVYRTLESLFEALDRLVSVNRGGQIHI